MRKIKFYLCGILFILALLFTTRVNAVGTISLSASKSTINVGDEFSISVNLSGASVATLTARVSVDTSKVDYVSGPSNSSFANGRAIYTWTDPTGGSNPKTSGTIVTFKFKAKQVGKASFSVGGDFYSPDEKNVNPSFSGTSVTIQEKITTPPTTGGTTGGGSTGGTTGGNTGGNTGGTSGGGNQGSTNQGGTSSGTNKPSGGITTNLSTNANLKELHLDVEGLSPSFNKNTTNYSIVIQDRDSISINAISEDSKAKVSITGNTNLKTGLNKITIKVTAEDGKTTKTYIVNATKTDNPDLANASLENLAIENVTLNPEFNKDVLQYNAQISSDTEKLNILAVPQIEGATVNIQGGDNLSFGENTIKISVIAKDGVTTKNYTIMAYKKTQEEEAQEIQPINLEEFTKEEMPESVNVGTIVFSVIVVCSIGGVIFILVRKYINENR